MNGLTDKKKIVVVTALGVVLLGVGAFQFSRISGSEAPAAQSQAADKSSEQAAEPVSEETLLASNVALVSGSYPERDPFKPQMTEGLEPNYTRQPTPRPTPIRPMPLAGNISLPSVSLNPSALPGTLPENPEFPYRLTGLIVGNRPAAVFVDAQGAQRLVTLNSALDPDTRVIGIEREKVVLRHGTKTLNLTLGGENESEK